MNATQALREALPHRLIIGRRSIRVRDLVDASHEYQDARDASGLGVSKFPEGRIAIDGKTYRVSYNGRVWDGAHMVIEAQ